MTLLTSSVSLPLSVLQPQASRKYLSAVPDHLFERTFAHQGVRACRVVIFFPTVSPFLYAKYHQARISLYLILTVG